MQQVVWKLPKFTNVENQKIFFGTSSFPIHSILEDNFKVGVKNQIFLDTDSFEGMTIKISKGRGKYVY